jgi:hypothetical protein
MMRPTMGTWTSRARTVAGGLAAEPWLLTAALGLLWATRVALSVFPVRVVAGWLDRLPAGPAHPAGGVYPERVAQAVGRASRLVPGATCLVQALVAKALLERHGLSTRLRMGVVRDAGQGVRGHAWLESHGQAVFGKDVAERWHSLLTLDEARAWSPAPDRRA